MNDHEKTIKRRRSMAEAASKMLGEILFKARNTEDASELIRLRAEAEQIDPEQPLDALLVLSDFVAELKPANLSKAVSAKNKADKTVHDKRREIEETTARLSQELDDAINAQREATALHARAVVDDNRMSALKTGVALPGAQDYARPVIRAWAKLAKLI